MTLLKRTRCTRILGLMFDITETANSHNAEAWAWCLVGDHSRRCEYLKSHSLNAVKWSKTQM
jgi:hypothetical protein